MKEDLIIPHPITFYELILTKARGKSGPLFHFDVHDDIRLTDDHRIEKDESHPGKIVEKRWYEESGDKRRAETSGEKRRESNHLPLRVLLCDIVCVGM